MPVRLLDEVGEGGGLRRVHVDADAELTGEAACGLEASRRERPRQHGREHDAQAAAGRIVVIAHEASRTGGIGGEIAAILAEEAFEWLDAPVVRVASIDTPVPYSPPLEQYFLPSDADIERAARLLVSY